MTTRDSLRAWMGDRDTEGGGLEAEAMLAQLRRRMFDRSDAVVCVGKYRDLVEIGRGGMSVVYRGRDEAPRHTDFVARLGPWLDSRTPTWSRCSKSANTKARPSWSWSW